MSGIHIRLNSISGDIIKVFDNHKHFNETQKAGFHHSKSPGRNLIHGCEAEEAAYGYQHNNIEEEWEKNAGLSSQENLSSQKNLWSS